MFDGLHFGFGVGDRVGQLYGLILFIVMTLFSFNSFPLWFF